MFVMPPLYGGTPAYRRRVVEAWQKFASRFPWYVATARVAALRVTNDPKVAAQVAMYQHDSRDLLLSPNVGNLLDRAVTHELAHGFDDWNGNPHRFSMTDDWVRLHKMQGVFEIPTYATDPREFFADVASKCILLGAERTGIQYPGETVYMTQVVFPRLQMEYASGVSL
jgi:hypothetical protein